MKGWSVSPQSRGVRPHTQQLCLDTDANIVRNHGFALALRPRRYSAMIIDASVIIPWTAACEY